ncbi:MAG: SDR family NAD(P)-dependent oxidoreductase [Gammaproteobacteria bacterium]|nr:SDR family NAD(P)-dependent oxidoreductase [Gammaproteobacteria bacterium]
MDIQDGVAIVTGSSSGVGAACACQLAEKGCHVVINFAHNEAGARETQAACEAFGVETAVVQADVADDDGCRALASAAVDKWGRIDALVNNAGTTKFNAHDNLEGLTREDFLDIYAVNTVGAYQATRAVAPVMRTGGRGSIVNVSSTAGVTGGGSSVAYAASKGALITMTLSLARALGPEIRVNAVCPGFIQGSWLESGMGAERYAAAKAALEASAPLRLTATPDTVAESILYFIEGADLVTGETLILDGGARLSQIQLAQR